MSITAHRPIVRRGSLLVLPADVVSVIGVAAVAFSALYLLSDVIELAQGGFSTAQLVLTYISEAAIPLFVIGIYAAQRPGIGRLGLLGAAGYAYTFVFFTSTVVFALVQHTSDWDALSSRWVPGSPSTPCSWSSPAWSSATRSFVPASFHAGPVGSSCSECCR